MMSELDTERHNFGGDNGTPKVSVIIPAYKAAEYIGATLKSVFEQTFKDYEVIVVNDGAPDTEETERVLEPYLGRIVYIKQENRGVSGARNTAIRNARGEYVALLDSDDMWEPEYLEIQVAALESDPSIDVIYPNGVIFGGGPGTGRKCMDLSPSEGEVTFESLITQRCTVLTFVTARRETILRAGLLDEALRSSEDFDLWLRIVKQGGRIAYHRRELARYRSRRGSLSADPVWMCQHILKVFDKAARTLELTPREREVLAQQSVRFRAVQRLCEGKRALFRGEVEKAIEGLTEANAFFKSRKIAATRLLLRFAPRLLRRAYDMRDRFIFRTDTKF